MHVVIAIATERVAQMIDTRRHDKNDPNKSIMKAPKFFAIGVADNKVPRISVSLLKIMKYKNSLQRSVQKNGGNKCFARAQNI